MTDFFPEAGGTLVNHYEGLGDIRSDFRNYNLMRLVASLVKGKSVLDIGCGSGFLLGLLEAAGKEVYGVEPAGELISLAKKYYPGVTIFKGYAEDLPALVSRRVDTIVMTDVLEHIENDKEQLEKVYDQLNSGGHLLLVVPAYQLLYGKRDYNMGHFRRYSKNHLAKLCGEAGFTLQSIRYWNMLGVIPYLISEKILRKELGTSLRTRESTQKGFKKVINYFLHHWFRLVENNFNLGFGLSLVCMAKKTPPLQATAELN